MGTYNWTYTVGGGTVTFITSDTPTSGTQYEVTGVTGTMNGSNITGLGFAPGSQLYQTTENNLLDSSVSPSFGYIAPGDGISFTTADGKTYSFEHQLSIDPMDEERPTREYFWVAKYVGGVLNRADSDTPTVASFGAACFARDTLIATLEGSIPVQDIQIGGLVLNQQGNSVPVKWVGRQRFNPLFGKDNLPICIKAGALGAGVPTRDLYVSPDHALCIDDCLLVHASALVNGRTIYQVREWPGDVEYYHIETENHEIILAEGTPVETYMDNVSRSAFYNHAEYETLYPQAKKMVELDLPRVKYARQLPNIVKERFNRIADDLTQNEILDVA